MGQTDRVLVADFHWAIPVTSFEKLRDAGVRGVILKVSEGLTFTDKKYRQRRRDAAAAGLRVGGYHFHRPGTVQKQVKIFLSAAEYEPDMLLCLDHEDDRVSAAQAREFLEEIEVATGVRQVLYSGNTISEQLGSHVDEYLGSCRNWIPRYSSKLPVVQKSWNGRMWLHQFTDGKSGPRPHGLPGVSGSGLDLSAYYGPEHNLLSEWAGRVLPTVSAPALTPDIAPQACRVEEHDVEWAQRSLNKILGTKLTVDGLRGPRTKAAIMKFQKMAEITYDGAFGPETEAAICRFLSRHEVCQ
jgi:lysozyme